MTDTLVQHRYEMMMTVVSSSGPFEHTHSRTRTHMDTHAGGAQETMTILVVVVMMTMIIYLAVFSCLAV